jgi:hypothetical protein
VARSVAPAQMSKLRAIRAIAGIAVANTIAAANPYLIKGGRSATGRYPGGDVGAPRSARLRVSPAVGRTAKSQSPGHQAPQAY